MLSAAAVIGGVPSAAFVGLLIWGGTDPWPVAICLLLTVAWSVALAVIWVGDMGKLGHALRVAATPAATPGESPGFSPAAVSPLLPPVERTARAMERLARTLAEREHRVALALRANEAIVEELPDLLLVLARDGSVRRANAAARAAFGDDMAAVVRHPDLRAAIEQAFARRAPQSVELILPVPVRRDVNATVLVLDPPLNDGGQAIAVLSDRTRDRAVERMRADFVANASHELRTPLASLIGFIHTLRGPAADDPPAQRRFLGIMAEQAERMNRLIDDLLSLSRIELTEHQPPSQMVDLSQAAERIAAAFEPQILTRAATLRLDVEAGLPKVPADADQIEQVLQNLVENAVKYGRDGGEVRLCVRAAKPGGRWPGRKGVVLSVADDGYGIPKSDVPRLTERFYRVDKGRSRTEGGTGLGLAIVKHIVNRHRGLLVIESEEGRGSTFSVWLPLAPERPVSEK